MRICLALAGAVRGTEFGHSTPPFANPARHARPCAGHPRPEAIVNFKRCLPRRRVDGRDKPGHDVEGGAQPNYVSDSATFSFYPGCPIAPAGSGAASRPNATPCASGPQTSKFFPRKTFGLTKNT
jgi:hypothetical protein